MRSVRFSAAPDDRTPLPRLAQELSPTTRFILENKSDTAFPVCTRRLFRQCYTFFRYEMTLAFHEPSTLFLLGGISFDKKHYAYDRGALLLLFHRLDQDFVPSWEKIRPDGTMAWWDEFAAACQEYARARREMGTVHGLVRECQAVLHRLLRAHDDGANRDALRAAAGRLEEWRALLRRWRYPCLGHEEPARPSAAQADHFLRSVVRNDGVLLDLLWADGEFFGTGRTMIRAMTRAWQEKESSMAAVGGPDWEEVSSDEDGVLWMNRRYYEGIPDKMILKR